MPSFPTTNGMPISSTASVVMELKTRELLDQDNAYQMLDEEVYDMVAAYVGEEEVMLKRKEKYKKGGKVNMCQGLREWLADERMEGRAEAIVELLSEYGSISEDLKGIIMKEKNKETLSIWLKLAARVNSIKEFEQKIAELKSYTF